MTETKRDSLRGCSNIQLLVEAKRDFVGCIIKGGVYRVTSMNWDSHGFQYCVHVDSLCGYNYLPAEWFNVIGGTNVIK